MDKQIEEILCCKKCYKAETGLCDKSVIPENAVVLTREELAQIQSNFFDAGIKHGSKETVDKFAERFKENAMYSHKDGFDYYVIYTDEFDEICKGITEGKV